MRIEEFTKYLEGIAKITGRSNIDDFIVGLYWESLEKSLDEALRTALKGFFTKNRWPSIDDIKAEMGEKTESIEDRARKVALEISDFIRKKGYAAEKEVMEFLSPIAKTIVIRSGGWASICSLGSQEALIWKQKDWVKEATDLISFGRLGDLIGLTPVNDLISGLCSTIKDVAKTTEWPDFPETAEKGRGESFPALVGGKWQGGEKLTELYKRISESMKTEDEKNNGKGPIYPK
jgi:hypothetical protein